VCVLVGIGVFYFLINLKICMNGSLGFFVFFLKKICEVIVHKRNEPNWTRGQTET